MNIKHLIAENQTDETRDDINLEHHVNKLSRYIDENKPVNKLKQQYNIVLYYNKKATFNNTAELYETEFKMSSYYNALSKQNETVKY